MRFKGCSLLLHLCVLFHLSFVIPVFFFFIHMAPVVRKGYLWTGKSFRKVDHLCPFLMSSKSVAVSLQGDLRQYCGSQHKASETVFACSVFISRKYIIRQMIYLKMSWIPFLSFWLLLIKFWSIWAEGGFKDDLTQCPNIHAFKHHNSQLSS